MSLSDIFRKLDMKKRDTGGQPGFIIAGLGNPGDKYTGTRHNAGFDAVDRIAGLSGVKIDRLRFKALTAVAMIGDGKALLMKPQTFMNNSGEAISEAASFYKIPPEKVIVICDDTALPAGSVRIRRSGSPGGHKGLCSTELMLGTEEYPRIRLGVGEKPRPEYDMCDWVLGKLPDDDRKLVSSRFDSLLPAVELIMKGDYESAMSRYNVNIKARNEKA